jgi:hypothetical protein
MTRDDATMTRQGPDDDAPIADDDATDDAGARRMTMPRAAPRS